MGNPNMKGNRNLELRREMGAGDGIIAVSMTWISQGRVGGRGRDADCGVGS